MNDPQTQEYDSLRKATLVFLVKKNDEGAISEVCLAMKKRGFGEGRWNGVGGKVGDKVQESVEEAALREAKEEIGVELGRLDKVAELVFEFPHNPDWNQVVHVFLTDQWEGEPQESEEMRPEWFAVDDIPYGSMWPDDIYWLPAVLQGEKLRGKFVFGENDSVLDRRILYVSDLGSD